MDCFLKRALKQPVLLMALRKWLQKKMAIVTEMVMATLRVTVSIVIAMAKTEMANYVVIATTSNNTDHLYVP